MLHPKYWLAGILSAMICLNSTAAVTAHEVCPEPSDAETAVALVGDSAPTELEESLKVGQILTYTFSGAITSVSSSNENAVTVEVQTADSKNVDITAKKNGTADVLVKLQSGFSYLIHVTVGNGSSGGDTGNTEQNVRYDLNGLALQKGDTLEFNLSGDPGDTIQVHFYYTDDNGTAASSIVGALGGTVLDSKGDKTVTFTAPNAIDSRTVKIVYHGTMPSCSYLVKHNGTTPITTTTTTDTPPKQTTTTTTVTRPVLSDPEKAMALKAQKQATPFAVQQDTFDNLTTYDMFGKLDYVQELTDAFGNVYAMVGDGDTAHLISKKENKEVASYTKEGFTIGAAAIDTDKNDLYLLFGKDMADVDKDENNILICRCSMDGEIVNAYQFSTASTNAQLPFDGGNANLIYRDGILAVMFDCQWKSGHQGAEVLLFNTRDKSLPFFRSNICSHSFGLSLIPTEKGFASVQRGDCYDRGLILHELTGDYKTIQSRIGFHVSGIYGEPGQHQNDTHILMGGVAAAGSTYAVAGKSERVYASKNYSDYETGVYDVFVRLLPQDSTAALPLAGVDRLDSVTGDVADTNVVWLTSCDKKMQAGNVKIVSLSENRYCVLWETFKENVFDHISYVILDEYGNLLQEESTISNARLSNTTIPPIVQDTNLIWAVADTKAKGLQWYSVDLSGNAATVAGDLNADGALTVADVVLLQKYLLGLEKLTAEQWESADCTADGKINAADLALLKRELKTS